MLGFKTLIPLFVILLQNELVFCRTPRISGGSNASKGDFPFAVSFQRQGTNRHFCGGTIIHERFVLTAAHCTKVPGFANARIVAGVTKLNSHLEHENIRQIKNKYTFGHNEPKPKDNDIALVEVVTPFVFSDKISKANLVQPTYDYTSNTKVYIAGWGKLQETKQDPSNKLQKYKVKIYDNAECQTKYQNRLTIYSEVFCTLDTNRFTSKGVCNGDSGGPVVINGNTLVGVIKGGYHGGPHDPNLTPKCGSKNFPDMHTRVVPFITKINEIISGH